MIISFLWVSVSLLLNLVQPRLLIVRLARLLGLVFGHVRQIWHFRFVLDRVSSGGTVVYCGIRCALRIFYLPSRFQLLWGRREESPTTTLANHLIIRRRT